MITLVINIQDTPKDLLIHALGSNIGGGEPTEREKAATEAICEFIQAHSKRVKGAVNGHPTNIMVGPPKPKTAGAKSTVWQEAPQRGGLGEEEP